MESKLFSTLFLIFRTSRFDFLVGLVESGRYLSWSDITKACVVVLRVDYPSSR